MSKEKTNKAAKVIIDDVIDLSCKLSVFKDAGNDLFERLHSIQSQARNLLVDYPTNNFARETMAMLNGLNDMLIEAGSKDVSIPSEDLQHVLVTMDLVGDTVRNYLIPRVNPPVIRSTNESMDQTAA